MATVDAQQGLDVADYNEQTESLGCCSMLILARRGHFHVYILYDEKLMKLIQIT